jgi:hypothetical protein
MSTKKIIIISTVVIAIIALGLGIFFAWQKSSQAPIEETLPGLVTGTATSTSIIQTKSVAGTLSVISKNKVFDYWIYTPNVTSTPTKSIVYISPDGVINAITDGKEQRINNLQTSNIQSVKAAPDGRLVYIKSGGNNIKFDILNLETNIWQPTITDISSADWSLDGTKFAYFQNNPATKGFDLMIKDVNINAPAIIATSTKSTGNSKSKVQQPQKIISLNQADFDLKWYETDVIFLVPKASIDYISEIWKINIKTKVISKVTSGNSLMLNWLRFGNLGLKFVGDAGRNYNLALIDNNDNMKGSFKFKTFPDKCLFSSLVQIYCAISKDQSVFLSNNFPDDYYKKSIYFKDGIYSIDLTKNQLTSLFDSNNSIDAVNLNLFGGKMLFINRYDQKLYSLDL